MDAIFSAHLRDFAKNQKVPETSDMKSGEQG